VGLAPYPYVIFLSSQTMTSFTPDISSVAVLEIAKFAGPFDKSIVVGISREIREGTVVSANLGPNISFQNY
jgi:hypothetical protein